MMILQRMSLLLILFMIVLHTSASTTSLAHNEHQVGSSQLRLRSSSRNVGETKDSTEASPSASLIPTVAPSTTPADKSPSSMSFSEMLSNPNGDNDLSQEDSSSSLGLKLSVVILVIVATLCMALVAVLIMYRARRGSGLYRNQPGSPTKSRGTSTQSSRPDHSDRQEKGIDPMNHADDMECFYYRSQRTMMVPFRTGTVQPEVVSPSLCPPDGAPRRPPRSTITATSNMYYSPQRNRRRPPRTTRPVRSTSRNKHTMMMAQRMMHARMDQELSLADLYDLQLDLEPDQEIAKPLTDKNDDTLDDEKELDVTLNSDSTATTSHDTSLDSSDGGQNHSLEQFMEDTQASVLASPPNDKDSE